VNRDPNGRMTAPAHVVQSATSPAIRIAALQAAATFAAGKCLGGIDISSQDLLEVAEAFERWLLEREAGNA
jgi:hypothetical protein